MALSRSAQTASTILVLTSLLLLINVVMTSSSPSAARPLPDVSTAGETSQRAKLAPETTDFDGIVDCPRGHYYGEVARACKRCSGCPVNQIIRQPCSARADTICGPFFEFSQFHQSPVAEESSEMTQEDNHAQGPHGTGQQAPSRSEDSQASADQRSVRVAKATAAGQWRTLSFALIAVLSFICCLVVIVGLYVYIILRRSHTQSVVFRQSELLAPRSYPYVDPEPRYVDITYALSHNRSRTPRHWPLYQQILTGSDVTELLPATPLVGNSKEEVVNPVDEGEYVSVYVNTEALDGKGS